MAKVKVRYFVEKPGAGDAMRYFWQPSKILRAMGWLSERLPDDKGQAIARADRLNRELDAWRTGTPLPPALPGQADGGVGGAAAGSMAPAKPYTEAKIVRPGSIAWLIREYKLSRFFTRLAEKTQYEYGLNLAVIEAWAGEAPVGAIGKARIETFYEKLRARTPAKANAVIGMLRILLGHAVRLEILKENPATNPGLIGLPFAGRIWPIDAVSLIVETCDRSGWHSIGTAIVVNHWIGQRKGDILDLGRNAWRDGRFHRTQNKTGERVSIPHSPWVEDRVKSELARQEQRGITSATHLILCETTGQSWKSDHFSHVFAEIRDKAAAEWSTFWLNEEDTVDTGDLLFMHLRHTAVTELAIAGCSIPQIAAITGHTPKSVINILRRYLVMTAALADAAVAKRLQLDNDIAALVDETRAGKGRG